MPVTVPALRSWLPGKGECRLERWCLEAPAALDVGVSLLLEELACLGVPAKRVAEEGNVVVRIDAALTDALGEEGFRLSVGTNDVVVRAAAPAGGLHGLRVLSQWIRQGSLSVGEGEDRPRYRERGVTLCASQINIDSGWMDRLLTDMADCRMSQLVLELKLRTDDERQNFWSLHEPGRIRALVERAAGLGIDVVPEINSPGHMGVWLRHRPDLQLRDNDGVRQPVQLDLSHPDAVGFYMHLVDQYLEVFDSPFWHMGGDEYMIHTSFARYDALTAWARRTYGDGATIADAHIAFINAVNTEVRARGKRLRIWNDGILDTSVVQLDRDIVVDFWFADGQVASELLRRGHTVANVHQALYFSRSHRPYKVDARALWERGWHVGEFDGSAVEPDHPALSGLRMSLWPDESFRQTEHEVEIEAFEALRFTAQLAWHGDHHGFVAFEDFREASLRVGHSPARPDPLEPELPAGRYTIGRDGRFLGHGPHGVALVEEPQPWEVRPTLDGYVQLVHRDGALSLVDGARFLGVVMQAGARPSFAVPARMADRAYETSDHRNPQKWRMISVGDGVRIVHGLSNAELTVIRGDERSIEFSVHPDDDVELTDQSLRPAPGTVVQLPPSLARGSWLLKPVQD